MRTLKYLVVAGVIGCVASPAFAGAAKAKSSHTLVAKKKHDKKEEEKCDAAGKPCKEGDDCKASNCKPAEPAPQN